MNYSDYLVGYSPSSGDIVYNLHIKGSFKQLIYVVPLIDKNYEPLERGNQPQPKLTTQTLSIHTN